MHIGLRIFFGFFLVVGLAAFLTLRVFVQEVKPGVRQAMEDTLVDTANVLAVLAADDDWAARTVQIPDLTANRHGVGRDLFGGFRKHVGTAEMGACSLFADEG